MNNIKNQRGLTLIELLAVVIILGIIAAIAVPSISKVIDNTRKDAHIANATQVIYAAKLAMASGYEPTNICDESKKEYMYTVDELVTQGLMSDKLKNPRLIPGYGDEDYALEYSIVTIENIDTNPVYKANLQMGGNGGFEGNYIFNEPLRVGYMKRYKIKPCPGSNECN